MAGADLEHDLADVLDKLLPPKPRALHRRVEARREHPVRHAEEDAEQQERDMSDIGDTSEIGDEAQRRKPPTMNLYVICKHSEWSLGNSHVMYSYCQDWNQMFR